MVEKLEALRIHNQGNTAMNKNGISRSSLVDFHGVLPPGAATLFDQNTQPRPRRSTFLLQQLLKMKDGTVGYGDH